jgi:hypothetical protein
VLGSSLFAVTVNTWYSHKLLGYGMMAQLHDQIGTLLLTLLAALAGWPVLHWMPAGTQATIIATMVAAATYFTGAALGRHTALADVIELARLLRSGNVPSSELMNES